MPDPAAPRLQTVADALIRGRYVLLALALVLLGLAWPLAARLEFDQSIESLFAEHDPRLVDYQQSKAWFGGDEFVIVAFTDPGLFHPRTARLSPDSAERIEKFSDELSRISGVMTESTQNLVEMLSPKPVEVAVFGRTRRMSVYPPRQMRDEHARGLLLGDDDETTAIILRLVPEGEAPVPRERTIADVRAMADRFSEAHGLPVYVVGEPVQVHDMFRYVEEDGRLFLTWSLGLLAVVIVFLFRSLRWMLLPLLVVAATIVWTRAVLVLGSFQLSMVSSMLNALATIIAVATVTHVTVHYRERRRTLPRREALRETLAVLAPPVFWTCATTAVGFAALLSSRITPVRSFSLMMTLAVLMVLLAVASIVPGGALLGRFDADPRRTPAEQRLLRGLGGLIGWVERRPRLVGLLSLAAVVVAALGFLRLDVETDFSKNFRRNSPIVQSLIFVETRLGGAGNWEVNFAAPSQLDSEYLSRVRETTARLRAEMVEPDEYQLTKAVALTDGLDTVPAIPFVTWARQDRIDVLQQLQPEFLPSLYNAEEGRMRLVLRAKERQRSEEKLHLIERTEQLARQDFPDAKATGLFLLLAHLVASLLADQVTSFVLAATGIALMMTIAFRSLWIGLISLVPNFFPLVLVIGGMGWVGLPINIGTAMIASISLGLTVDGSIHYLSGYRRARRQGLDVMDALRETQRGVGRAILFANLALIVGFLVLTVSHFIPLIHFGVLVAASMLGGLIGDLIVLPLLLRWAGTKGWRWA